MGGEQDRYRSPEYAPTTPGTSSEAPGPGLGSLDSADIEKRIKEALGACHTTDSEDAYRAVYTLMNHAKFTMPDSRFKAYLRELVSITHARYLFAKGKDSERVKQANHNFLTALRRAQTADLMDLVQKYSDEMAELQKMERPADTATIKIA